MSKTKKVSRVFTEILLLSGHLLVWYFCIAFAVIFVWLKWFGSYIAGESPVTELNSPRMSLLFKKNKKEGRIKINSYTHASSSSIYSSFGERVGTIAREAKIDYSKDYRQYVPRYLLLFLYINSWVVQRSKSGEPKPTALCFALIYVIKTVV